MIIASRSSSNSADAVSSGTHGKSASAHAPAATRPRASEKLLHCLSRATAREGRRSGWEMADGKERVGGQRARAFKIRARGYHGRSRVARLVARRGRGMRARLDPDSPVIRFRSRPRKYSKKPRRRSGRRRTRGDPAARTDSGRGARNRGSARALVRREDASRGRARPRGRARSGRGQRANGTERDRHRGGWRFRARRGDAARFEPGDATRANAREAAGGTERSETAATGASRACYSGNDGACVCASADAFSKPFVVFCREKFVRASFSDATSGRPLASPEDFFAASPSEI